MISVIILILGLLIFLAHFFTALFKRTFIPDILLLTLLGILIGPAFGLVTPDMFGVVGRHFTTIALIVILFEGGTNMKLAQLRDSIGPTMGVTMVTFFVTVLIVVGVTQFVTTRRDFENASYRIDAGLDGDTVTIAFPDGSPPKLERGHILALKDQGMQTRVVRADVDLDGNGIRAKVGAWRTTDTAASGVKTVDSVFTEEATNFPQIAYSIQRRAEDSLVTLTMPSSVEARIDSGAMIRLLDQAAEAPVLNVQYTTAPPVSESDDLSSLTKVALLRVGLWKRAVGDPSPLIASGVGLRHVVSRTATHPTKGLGMQARIRINLLVGFLIGCILAGTSSAVVVPLVSMLRMKEEPGTVLVLESAITDVLCIVLTLGILQAASVGRLETGKLVGDILAAFVGAGVIGIVGAFAWSLLLSRVRQFPNTIFTTFAFIFILYGIAETLGWSGAIMALSFGITLANARTIRVMLRRNAGADDLEMSEFSEVERAFFSEAVFLLKTFFFIFLGLSLQFNDLSLVALGLVITILVFLARPFVVRFVTPRDTTRRDASYMAIMVPKGLAAAVLASLPRQAGLALGSTIEGIVYGVIFFSLLIVSALVFLLQTNAGKSIYYRLYASFAETDAPTDLQPDGPDVI